MALALKQNPRITASVYDIAAARAGVRSARSLANPDLIFTPSVLGTGGADEELLLRQPLELNGARQARAGVARAQLTQAEAEATAQLRLLVFETKTAYYELARAQRLRSVAAENLNLALELDRITRRQVEVGSRPGIDQTQTGIEVTRARQQVVIAESEVTAALVTLNTLTGRPAAEPLAELPPLPTPVQVEPLERDTLVQQALANRSEIRLERARSEQFRQEGRLARAEGRPDLAPQLRAGTATRGLKDAGVGLGITLPLLDWGSRRNRIRQADEAAGAQTARVSAAENSVRQEVEQAVARVRAAQQVLSDYQQGVLEQAQTLLTGSRKSFEAGLTSVVQFLEGQRTYRSVLTEYANAAADLAEARAQLERATGAVSPTLLPTPVTTREKVKP